MISFKCDFRREWDFAGAMDSLILQGFAVFPSFSFKYLLRGLLNVTSETIILHDFITVSVQMYISATLESLVCIFL